MKKKKMKYLKDCATFPEERNTVSEINLIPAKINTICGDTETERYDPANWPELFDYKIRILREAL